jgi:hypothetical protein
VERQIRDARALHAFILAESTVAAVMLRTRAEVAMRGVMIVLLAVVVQAATAVAGQGIDPNEPVMLAGASYYPSGPTVFFDGAVMVRTGSFKGVSIYVDATRDPYNIVYVPIGNKLMRPYERRAADRAADTLVPPPPAAPIEAEPLAAEAVLKETPPADYGPLPAQARRPASYAGASRPGDNRGIWIAFDGKIWVLADRQPYASRALAPNGTYRGFPVYRDPANPNQIFVSSGMSGFLARYTLDERR